MLIIPPQHVDTGQFLRVIVHSDSTPLLELAVRNPTQREYILPVIGHFNSFDEAIKLDRSSGGTLHTLLREAAFDAHLITDVIPKLHKKIKKS